MFYDHLIQGLLLSIDPENKYQVACEMNESADTTTFHIRFTELQYDESIPLAAGTVHREMKQIKHLAANFESFVSESQLRRLNPTYSNRPGEKQEVSFHLFKPQADQLFNILTSSLVKKVWNLLSSDKQLRDSVNFLEGVINDQQRVLDSYNRGYDLEAQLFRQHLQSDQLSTVTPEMAKVRLSPVDRILERSDKDQQSTDYSK